MRLFIFLLISMAACSQPDPDPVLATYLTDDSCYELELDLGLYSAKVNGTEFTWNNSLFHIELLDSVGHINSVGEKLRIVCINELVFCNIRCRNVQPNVSFWSQGFYPPDNHYRRVFHNDLTTKLRNGHRFKMWLQFDNEQFIF